MYFPTGEPVTINNSHPIYRASPSNILPNTKLYYRPDHSLKDVPDTVDPSFSEPGVARGCRSPSHPVPLVASQDSPITSSSSFLPSSPSSTYVYRLGARDNRRGSSTVMAYPRLQSMGGSFQTTPPASTLATTTVSPPTMVTSSFASSMASSKMPSETLRGRAFRDHESVDYLFSQSSTGRADSATTCHRGTGSRVTFGTLETGAKDSTGVAPALSSTPSEARRPLSAVSCSSLLPLTGPLLEPLGPTQPVATIEDFDTMVGDLRRTFRSWLKKVESELRRERETLETEKKQFEEERQRIRTALVTERQTETAKLQMERKRVEHELAESVKQIAVEREDARQRMIGEREKFEKEREVWRREVMMEREKFIADCEAFDAERRKIVDTNTAVQTAVELNVGGVIFETSRLLLVQQPGSLLEGLMSGRHRVTRDRNGRIFLDRDSELFRTLLQFLRNPAIPPCPRDAVESSLLCAESAYFGLKFYPFPLVFAIGGHDGTDHLSSTELLDVGQECWRPCAPLSTARTYFGYATYHGQLFTFGGQNYDYKALCDCEIYDVLRNTWMPGPNLNIPRRNTCGNAIGSRIFAIGGFDGANILGSVESYDPRMKNWMGIHSLTTPRSSATCTVLGDTLYVLGGTSGERLRTVERYDIRADKWESLDNGMIEVRSSACSVGLFHSIFVVGGTDNAHRTHSSVEALEIESTKWIFRRSLPEPRMDAASVVVSGSMMLAGGQNDQVLESTLFYRPESDEWRAGPRMLSPRYGHGLLIANV